MSDAVVGGVVGAVVAAGLAVAGAASVAWREVTLHDEQAAERNERLLVWVDAYNMALVRELGGVAEEFAGRNGFTSSAAAAALARCKTNALLRYRDQKEEAKIDLGRLKASEGPWHVFWRWVRRRGNGLELTAEKDVEPFLERWREPITRTGTGDAKVFDITTRSRKQALDDLQNSALT